MTSIDPMEIETTEMYVPMELDINEMLVAEEPKTDPIQVVHPSKENISTSAFYPQVRNELKPFKGQKFITWEEAHDFYKKYASAAGFIVRLGSSRRSKKTTEFIRREFYCNRQGHGPSELVGDEKRIRGVVREDCKARMIVVRVNFGGFVVTIFDEGHTHPMTSPRRLHLVKSNRGFTKAQRSLWEQLSMDLYNLERDKRKEKKGQDGDMLHDYLLLEQEINSGFCFTIKADAENKITHCFWADAISRQSYKFYGDVIIFDTTYQTNRYSLIFAPLMRINNHGQTVVFGAAFLSDETTYSFVWLLKEFLNAMPGGAPKMIITDQDPAMEKAISEVLPDTFHRYCSWHILRKFSEKLDAIKCRDHYEAFRKCIYSSENEEEFELKWRSVLAESVLSGHNWLQSIYEIRFRWVPAYMNHVFSAGMSSSQRAESAHSFFKDYVSDKNSLVEFMVQFNRGMLHKRHEELIVDHIDVNEKPRFKCPIKMEKQMSDIYTRKYYYKFQDQLWESYNYNLEVRSEDENKCTLKVTREDHEDGRAPGHHV
ncbi:PREDICTED: protein FAR1-RELATED SEQUENCE 5-like [Fragaria vesca subsp. vesca]